MSSFNPDFALRSIRNILASFERSYEITPKWWEVKSLKQAVEELDKHIQNGGALPEDWCPPLTRDNSLRIKFVTNPRAETARDEATAGVLYGVVEVNGVDHHVVLVRVKWQDMSDSAAEWREQVAVNDPHGEFQDFAALDGPFQTMHVPGRDGEWVLVIHPFGA